MKQNYFTLVTLGIIEEALRGQAADKLLEIVNSNLRDHEKEVFSAYFGVGCPKQDLAAIAQATGRTLEHTEAILARLLLKIRKQPDASDIWDSVDETSIMEKANHEVGKYWNTVPRSDLYFMNGGFYVNRNPYGPDKEAPSKGIPFDHHNEVMLMNMSDFHTTAIVLGQGEKRGIFIFEYAWGMQGFRYLGDNREDPFPYDEVRFCESYSETGGHTGFFAYRIGNEWGIIRIGDAACPYRRHEDVPFGEPSFEDALKHLCKHRKFNPERVWRTV